MRALRIIGKLLISMGCGVLLFVAWTLWGTGFYTSGQQDRLAAEFDSAPLLPPERGNGGSAEPGNDERPSGPPRNYRPDPGDPVFRLEIPAIGIRHIVVEGVDTEQLRMGPGHYPTCRDGFELCMDYPNEGWPGEDERVIVSGHRTTYGAPFWDLDRLRVGNQVRIETKWGRFIYSVTETEVVDSASRTIAIPGDRGELVLTTCNPKFSAAQRLIVYAELET
jgi:sortase A